MQRLIAKHIRGVPRHSIEDISQETYLRLLRLLPDEPIENLEAYILTVAAHVTVDLAMKDSRERKYMSFDSEQVDRLCELAADGWVNDPQNTAETEQEIAWLTKHLPPILLATLLLCGRDGLTQEEAAKRLGKSPHAVKKYLAEARTRCQVRANRR